VGGKEFQISGGQKDRLHVKQIHDWKEERNYYSAWGMCNPLRLERGERLQLNSKKDQRDGKDVNEEQHPMILLQAGQRKENPKRVKGREGIYESG